jgi:hypothetical protein
MHYIQKICPICNTGSIGFRRCSDGATIVLMCDECDSLWIIPNDILPGTVLYAQPPDYVVPGLACSISGGKAGWATIDEITDAGWSEAVVGEGNALDEF